MIYSLWFSEELPVPAGR